MKIKENIPLAVGLLIPFLMILFIGLSIYLPSLFVKPQYDFIYISGGDNYSVQKYEVVGKQLFEAEVTRFYFIVSRRLVY